MSIGDFKRQIFDEAPEPVQIDLKQLLDEILELKNKLFVIQAKEKETKRKILDLSDALGKDRKRAAVIFAELKRWAKTA